MNVYDSSGRPLQLGRKLGSGGEGAVYEIASQPSRVAKLYHKPPAALLQRKLSAMMSSAAPALLKIATWPTETLHATPNGAVSGFVMPSLNGQREIHALYSPAHRRNEFPRADWAMLVQAARNLAAAVETVHAHGHVIADVNQKNFVVAANATVLVVDCDGFQISVNGSTYPCEVGVAHFTPPELQERSFRGVTRTQNHDAFGLAVLIFHLLFMGRHPFAGRFRGAGDMPLERAIAEHRFAYGAFAARMQMEPPPGALPMAAIPPNVAGLFEHAFGSGSRPSATQWRTALEAMSAQLRKCARVPSHKFYANSGICTWCELEGRIGVIFFLGPAPATAVHVFDLAAVWRAIESVAPPRSLAPSPPRPAITGVVARPFEERTRRRVAIVTRTLTPIVAAIVLSFVPIPALASIAVIALIVMIVALKPLPGRDEAVRRKAALDVATDAWNEIQQRWVRESATNDFASELNRLRQKRDDYTKLESEHARERAALESAKRAKQLEHFLDQFYIDQAKIARIGPGRKATLASFGIETAADVVQWRIEQVPGFGPALAAELFVWRASIERRFVFDPKKQVDAQELARLDAKYTPRRREIELVLRAGASRLTAFREQITARRARLVDEIDDRAREWAQARADLDALR